MCLDCDNDSITQIPTGSQGIQGPTGPAPEIIGTSTSNLAVATGSKVFTGLNAELAWSVGQRLRASNEDATRIMEGEVTTFAGGELNLDVDYTEGSGSDNNWTINIAGARGATGSTGSAGSAGAEGAAGKNAYGTTSGIATSLGANLYTVPLANTYWGVVGQVVYIATAGYYQITAINAGVSFQVLDLQYTGNTPANMVASSGLGVSPGGLRGATGATGATGSTGADGATGPAGPAASFTRVLIPATSIAADNTSITIAATAGTTGTMFLTGFLQIESTAAVSLTASLWIGGVEQSSVNTIRATGPAAVGGISMITVPYTNYIPVIAADSVVIKITLNSYASSSDTIGGIFTYAIV